MPPKKLTKKTKSEAQVPKPEKKKHTAVVYFHGMGSQKRYEEVSRLVDALDRYDHESLNTGFRGIEADLEKPTSGLEREVGYIDSVFIDKNLPAPTRSVFRFYEAYWANLTAGGIPAKDVLFWIIKQSIIPLKALFVPWRDMQRLKRSVLMENWANFQARQPELNENDLKYMLTWYDEFESWDARRRYPQGRLRHFIDFIRQKSEDASRRDRLIWAAKNWQRQFTLANLATFFIIVTFLLVMALILLGLAAIISSAMQAVTPLTPTWMINLLGKEALDYTNPTNILLALGAVLTALGIPSFLSEYMGDVYFWTTYEETAEKHQKRRAILNHCANFLEHVLRTDCERVVMVAHSLGSTIAFETILELQRRNRTLRADKENLIPLEKLQHFFTMGSPIDKIFYFFESQSSNYHRYNRVVEDIRGDISQTPFLKDRKRHIHWVNFWDGADIISGSLQTPEGRKRPDLRVDNYEMSSYYFPFPGEAHLAYFESKEVIGAIYRAVFHNAYNFLTVSQQKGQKNYLAEHVGPGKGIRVTQPIQVLVLLLPWLITAYLIVRSLSLVSALSVLQYAVVGLAAVLVVWGVIGKIIVAVNGQINGLIPTSKRQDTIALAKHLIEEEET